ncbi:hypothetical protein Tco_1492194 [Tanacetum coccineum]
MISAMTFTTASYISIRLSIYREAITEVILYSTSPPSPSPPYDFSDHHQSLMYEVWTIPAHVVFEKLILEHSRNLKQRYDMNPSVFLRLS